MWGLLTMIYRSHKQQREEFKNDPEIQEYYRRLEIKDRRKKRVKKMKDKKYKVMLVSGGFDPVHKGHLEMIEKAQEMAEEVWVILNNDFWLKQKKGKPFMKEREREYIMSRVKGVTKHLYVTQEATDKTVCDGIYSSLTHSVESMMNHYLCR